MNPPNQNPYHMPEDATWLITGCSSGIGAALATLISTHPSHRLIATARDPSSLSYLPSSPNILKLPLDVTSPSSISSAFTAAEEYFNQPPGDFRLDIVVNNAGYSLSGDTEGFTEKDMQEEMDTLFGGVVRVSVKAVEKMREDGNGRGGVVFNMSSLAGVCAFPGHAFYHAGKWAVEGWSESFASEMKRDWNINFCILEPSGVKTNFEGHSKAHLTPHPAYAAPDMPARILESYVNKGIQSGQGMLQPTQIANAIYKIATSGEKIPLRVPLGVGAWKMIKSRYENLLAELEKVKGISGLGVEI